MLREGPARLRQWVAEARGGGLAGRRRRCAAVAAGPEMERIVQPLSRLVSLARDTAEQAGACLERFRVLQGSLARGVQDFLVVDADGLDEPAMGLVRTCLAVFQECDPLLRDDGLRALSAACDHVAQDCEHIADLLRSRDEAYSELRHYEDKVAMLRRQSGGQASGGSSSGEDSSGELLLETAASDPSLGTWQSSRLARNLDKLSHAKAAVVSQQCGWEAELQAFKARRTVHTRAVLLGLLRTYLRLLADWGRRASEAVASFDEELRPGTAVKVVGLPGVGQAGDDGFAATVEAREEATGRCVVSLRDGLRTAVRPESLCPLPRAGISVEPACGSCIAGCVAEVRCGGLDGPVSEALVGGVHAEVLTSAAWGARIRVPPAAAAGPKSVEVRTAKWRQRVAVSEAAFRYYEPVTFGPCGKNVELATSSASSQPPTGEAMRDVATRTSGLLDGVVLTAEPLPAVPAEGSPHGCQYYFEVEVLDAAQRCTGTTRTVSLGFAWSAPGEAAARPPEMARQLPRSFVVGGDLPRAYLSGRELCKVLGWRPLFDVAGGSVIGALLQVRAGSARLTVVQDGACRCSAEAELPEGRWEGAPHGVVDVCGTVQRVALRQGAEVPGAALQAASHQTPRQAAGREGPVHGGGGSAGSAQRRCLSVDSAWARV
mmetsp:Transcript_19695/g.59933  ORF Transcript_19695/g.59933 Transcript_19695/m.59933 type:complete len:660 (+) Transcript_19695:3-1982(+)